MSKYDKAEAKAEYLASPEYAQKQEQLARAEENKRQQAELDRKTEELNRKLKEKEESENKVNDVAIQQSHKEVEEQQNSEFLDQIVEKNLVKYRVDSEDKVLMKDRAYLAAGNLIKHNLKMTGVEKDKYLTKNFKKVWDHHDKEMKNILSESDVKSFFEDILTADG